MKYFVILFLFGNAVAQTVTTTTETVREETTVITVTQDRSSNTIVRTSVPIVYKCNGRTCVNP